MRMPHTPSTRLAAGIVCELLRGHASAQDICERRGLDATNPTTAITRTRRYLAAMHDLGAVYIRRWVQTNHRGRWYEVWALQPELFACPDAPRPKPYVKTK